MFWLSLLVGIAGLFLVFDGRTQPRIGLIVAVALPLLRAALDRPWRHRQLAAAHRLWDSQADPAASERRRWLAALLFVSVPALFFFALPPNYHIDSGDSWPVIPTAASVIRQGNFEIGEYVPIAPAGYLEQRGPDVLLPYCTVDTGHGIYSVYPVGMVAPALPVVAVSTLVGADFQRAKVLSRLDRWAAMLFAAATLAAFHRLSLALATPRGAWAASMLLAVGSTLFTVVAQSMWQHGGVVLGAILILLFEFDPRWRAHRAATLLQGIAAGWMLACRTNSGALLAVIGIWILVRDPLRALKFGAAAILGVAPWVAFYLAVYGTPLGPSAAQTVGTLWVPLQWDNWAGVMFSPGRGFLTFQIWAILIPLGIWLARPDRTVRGWPWMATAAILAQSVVLACWWNWWGGTCWGSRLMTDAIPFAGLLMLPAVDAMVKSRKGRWALVAIAVLGSLPHQRPFWGVPLTQPWTDRDPSTFWLLPRWKG